MASSNLVYGFLDESPSLTSRDFFFCVSIVVTKEQTNKQIADIFTRAHKKLLGKKTKFLGEIKFNNSSDKIRLYVLEELAKIDVQIVALIIDKSKRQIKDSPENYGLAVGAAIIPLAKLYPSISLTLDKHYTNSGQEKEFMNQVQETISSTKNLSAKIFFNPSVDSSRSVMIQMADFVAGALNKKYNFGDEQFIDLVKSKIKIEKKWLWTQLKRRTANA